MSYFHKIIHDLTKNIHPCMAGRNKLFSKHLICLLLTDLDINLMKRIIDSLDNLHHGLHRLLQLKLTISTAGECVWQVLEQQLILCQPLHRLEKIRRKRQLMSQLLLTAQQDGMVISHLRQGCLGRLHVLTVSEIIVCLYYTVIISQYTQWGMGTWNFIQYYKNSIVKTRDVWKYALCFQLKICQVGLDLQPLIVPKVIKFGTKLGTRV